MLKVCRVDDRLIHGQVATTWIGNNNIEVIVVVDDELCNDPFQISILKMAAKDCKVYVQSFEKFAGKYKQHILDDYNVMLIFKDVTMPLQLIKNGVPIKNLVVGGMANRDGRTAVTRSVAMTKKEADILREIAASNCFVEYRQVYADERKDLIPLIQQAGL